MARSNYGWVLVVGFLLFLMGARDTVELGENPKVSVLEGVLKGHPGGRYPMVLQTAGGQWCVLHENEKIQGGLRLRDVEPESRVRVVGRLASYYDDAKDAEGPVPFISTWVILMQVTQVKRLEPAPALPREPLPTDEENKTYMDTCRGERQTKECV